MSTKNYFSIITSNSKFCPATCTVTQGALCTQATMAGSGRRMASSLSLTAALAVLFLALAACKSPGDSDDGAVEQSRDLTATTFSSPGDGDDGAVEQPRDLRLQHSAARFRQI